MKLNKYIISQIKEKLETTKRMVTSLKFRYTWLIKNQGTCERKINYLNVEVLQRRN